MGCGSSAPVTSRSSSSSGSSKSSDDKHSIKRRKNSDKTVTNTTTTTNQDTKPTDNTTTTTTNGAAFRPDDNAIYGYDLYGDDHKKKDGGGDKEQDDRGVDKTEKNVNQNQYDDAGFYGQTEEERKEVELFDGGGKKPEQTDADVQEQDTQPPATDDNVQQETQPPAADDSVQQEGQPPAADDTVEQETQPPPAEDTTVTTDDKTEEEPPAVEGTQIVTDKNEEEAHVDEKADETEESEEKPPLDEDGVAATEEHKTSSDTDVQEVPVVPPPPAEENEGKAEDIIPEKQDVLKSTPPSDYKQNSVGLMTLFLDYRSQPDEDLSDRRPEVAAGELWTDRDFTLHQAIQDGSVTSNLTWKRATELNSAAKLFSEGTTRFDIEQGGAGTCYFLSTVANISENQQLVEQVIPDDAYAVGTPAYDGVFHARFWRFGDWDDVYVDDYLPVVYDTKPWGARSATDESEFWVSLLEKAFARYHGCYDAVYGGQPGDAYLALTGGVAERIDFNDDDHKPRKLFRRLHNAIKSGAHVTCTVPDRHDDKFGLVGGHAYSLTGTAKVKGTSLLRVRNPWGNTEWTGPWSDKSQEWEGVSQQDASHTVKDDGEFWICLEDFMTYFDQTTICSLTPDFDMDGRSDSLNYVANIYGEWQGETAAGFQKKLMNPRFLITVPESETEAAVVVQLIQRRQHRNIDNLQVRCDVYKVLSYNKESAALEIMGENTNSYCPETQCSFRHKVTPGTYAVVPSTIEGGQEKSFLLRVFTSCPLTNIMELPHTCKLMSCDQISTVSHEGQSYELSYFQADSGAWRAGVNSGGQISHRDSHASNPQYVISVCQPTPVCIQVMQEQAEPRMPVGLRLFPSGEAPLNIDQIYEMYDQCMATTDGTNYRFIQAWDMDASYMLQPGQYTLLLHMDEPDKNKLFTIVVKSAEPVQLKGHQTGK